MKLKIPMSILVILLCISLSACAMQLEPAVEAVNLNPIVEEAKEPEVFEVEILAVGDIMFHLPQIREARTESGYRFDLFFERVKPYIEGADIAIGNFETTVNTKKALAGYPRFNSPPEVVQGIRDAGFDVMVTANNHCMDTGVEGAENTAALMRQNGMVTLGVGEGNESIVVEVKGIKIGMLAYTNSINGLKAPEGYVSMAEEEKIKADIETIKSKCDFILVYMHAGVEYNREVEAETARLFRAVADMGADCVLGSHPHVARKSELYQTRGRQVLINYSMGNFLSNQNDKYTDIGTMTKLSIRKQENMTRLEKFEVIPTYRMRYTDTDGKTKRRVILVSDLDSYSQISDRDKSYIREISEEAVTLLSEEEKVVFNIEK